MTMPLPTDTDKPSPDTKNPPRNPEGLDLLFTLTGSAGRISLATFGVMVLAFAVWAFLGEISFRSSGIGIILEDQTATVDVVSAATGIVSEVYVSVGQEVVEGTPLATMRFPGRETTLAAQRKIVAELDKALLGQKRFVEESLKTRRANLDNEIEALRENIGNQKKFLSFLEQLNKTQQKELAKGYITRQQVEATVNELNQTRTSLRSLTNQISTTQIQSEQFENSQLESLRQMREQLLEQSSLLETDEVGFEVDSKINSPTAGVVTGVAVNPGTRIGPEAQIATISTRGERLGFIGYFSNADGKKLSAGMAARVAPLSVQRDIYGTIKGRVRSVSPMPETEADMMRTFGNPVLVKQLLSAGSPIRANIELFESSDSASGLDWTSRTGPPQAITAGTQAEVSATVYTARPIDLLMPILRTWIW